MLRILYVEDNEDNAYMLKMRLELTGEFEVLVAEDGEQGCEIAAAERPDRPGDAGRRKRHGA